MSTNEELIAHVRAAKEALLDEQRAEKVAKQHARGKQTARERIAALTSEFYEFGGLAGPGPANNGAAPLVAPGDGVVTGIGYVDGRPVALAAFDFTVLGGSNGAVGMAKLMRCADRCLRDKMPFVLLMDGGGHRMQEALDSRLAAPGSEFLLKITDLSGYVPLVAAMMGPGFGAPANIAASCDFVTIVRGTGTMGLSSDFLVKNGTGEEATNEELGGADRCARRGVVDLAVDDEAEALDAIRLYLSYLPSWQDGAPNLGSAGAEPGPDADRIDQLVPANTRQGYDVREVVEALCDDASVFELKPDFAPNVVTTLARLGGRPVGVVANQPLRLGGALDSPASEKAARFIGVCDAFGLPVVLLIDLPGFMVGVAAEESQLVRRSARIGYELGIATVPRAVVVTRKAYGAAYVVMGGGRSIDADLSIAWPTAEICAIPVESAVDIAFKSEYEKADDPQAKRAEFLELFRANIDPLLAAEGFGIDDVVLASETRRLLIETFTRAQPRRAQRVPDKRRSISPI
ncbi:MAG: carboxyl transferase domain-containing protein [Aeromicrobium sp.]|uniref:acyl-CoA carboxylase subunit beta n=1 Tax=Aeromicrobium sp. TaxID=1871063 RepID=UPI0039E3D504